MENKQSRVFVGLPLNKKRMISHVQMSQFRSSLSFGQLVNLTVYILYHFKKSGFLDESIVHCVDSTELAIDRQELLATLTIKGKKVRVYDDIDCDCGKRRTKRDKWGEQLILRLMCDQVGLSETSRDINKLH